MLLITAAHPRAQKDRERTESPVASLARQGSWAKSFKVRGQARNDAWEKEESVPMVRTSSAHAGTQTQAYKQHAYHATLPADVWLICITLTFCCRDASPCVCGVCVCVCVT